MKPHKKPNNRQIQYGDPSDWTLHPTKGWKRKGAKERTRPHPATGRLQRFFQARA